MSDSPIILGYDSETLRERIDVDAATARFEEIAQLRSLAALNEQVTLLRLLGRLDEAYEKAQAAARTSRFTGSREDSLAARVRRAQVTQSLGKLDAALAELTNCVDEAVNHGWAELAGFALQHRGKVLFELHRVEEALADFERALSYRETDGIPADQVTATKFAIRAARARLEGNSTLDDFDEPITSIDA